MRRSPPPSQQHSSDPERQISEERLIRRLKNKAFHYLGRYSSTEQRLYEVLQRFSRRKLEGVASDRLEKAIQTVISQCVSLGYVNDRAFAESQVRKGLQSGQSHAMIRAKLKAAGITQSDAEAGFEAATDHLDRNRMELLSALRFATRRRLGCFGRNHSDDIRASDPKLYEKQMAQLARRGFSYDIARQVLSLDSPESAEDMLNELESHFR